MQPRIARRSVILGAASAPIARVVATSYSPVVYMLVTAAGVMPGDLAFFIVRDAAKQLRRLG